MNIQDIVPGGVLTQSFGMTTYARSGAYGGRIHDGIDIAAPRGTNIYWPYPVSRTVRFWEPGGYGNGVLGYWNDVEFLFGHMMSYGNNTIAGYIDSTGFSTGNHTHLRIKVAGALVDPLEWLRNQGGSMAQSLESQVIDLNNQKAQLQAQLAACQAKNDSHVVHINNVVKQLTDAQVEIEQLRNTVPAADKELQARIERAIAALKGEVK